MWNFEFGFSFFTPYNLGFGTESVTVTTLVSKVGALKTCSSCIVIIYIRTNFTSHFPICPPEIAFDRARNGTKSGIKNPLFGNMFIWKYKNGYHSVNLQVKPV